MEYYLKYYNETVAVIEVSKEFIPFSMEIINPNRFFDGFNKFIMNEAQVAKWIKNRLRPESQVGFSKLTSQFNIDMENPYWYWTLFLKTNGLNIKDRLWLSKNELTTDGDNPWNSIINSNKAVPDLNKNLLNIFATKSIIGVDGACEKDIVRICGNLAIVKKSLQHNTYDCVAEELCYKIAQRIGVNCSPAGYIREDLCYSVIDENIDLIHAGDYLSYIDSDKMHMYGLLEKKGVPVSTKVDFLKMCLFDILTRQQDRNPTNFSFYESNGICHLYRLYDNGLSLFSASRFVDSKSFAMGRNVPSVDALLRFCKRKLKELDVDIVFWGALDEKFLKEIFEPYRDYIKSKNGNNIDDIVEWLLNQYEYIISS